MNGLASGGICCHTDGMLHCHRIVVIMLAALLVSSCNQLDQQVPTAIFDVALPQLMKADPGPAHKIGAVFHIKLTGKGGGDWNVDFKNAQVKHGKPKRPDLRIRMSVKDFAKMTRGELDVQKAIKDERIIVEGNAELVMSFARLVAGAK